MYLDYIYLHTPAQIRRCIWCIRTHLYWWYLVILRGKRKKDIRAVKSENVFFSRGIRFRTRCLGIPVLGDDESFGQHGLLVSIALDPRVRGGQDGDEQV